MKRFLTVAASVVSMFLLSGCIPFSLRPWYADSDVIFDPALVGVQVEKSEGATETTTITRDGAKGYRMRIVRVSEQGKEELRLRIRLFRIGQDEFLDYSPDADDENRTLPAVFPVVEGHLVAKVLQIRPQLKTVGLDAVWLERFLTDQPYALHHEIIEEDDKNGAEEYSRHDLVITASTPALRRFLHDHASDPQAFPPPDAQPDSGQSARSP